MLIRPKARIVSLSLKMPSGAILVRACHNEELFLSNPVESGGEVWRELRVREREGPRTLYELVAENAFEEVLLRGQAQLQKHSEGGRVCYVWRLGRPHNTSAQKRDVGSRSEQGS